MGTIFFGGSAYRIATAKGGALTTLERQHNLDFKPADWISLTQEYAFPLTIKDTDYYF